MCVALVIVHILTRCLTVTCIERIKGKNSKCHKSKNGYILCSNDI